MSTKILALSIECQSWLIVTWFVRLIIYCAPKEFIWFNCNYNQMVCFLKYWKDLVYILVGFWTPRSGFGIPGTVFQPLLIVKAEFRITHFSLLFTVTNGKLISSCGIPDSLSRILDSNAQDSASTSKVFTDSGIQQAKKKKFQDFGIQISPRRVIGVYSFNNFTYSDIDECTTSHPVCDVNANCTNTQGSYFCTCKTGFYGDGKTCQGRKTKTLTGITFFHTEILCY